MCNATNLRKERQVAVAVDEGTGQRCRYSKRTNTNAIRRFVFVRHVIEGNFKISLHAVTC